MPGFLIPLLVGMTLLVAGYLLMPKIKSSSSDSVQQMDAITSETGVPIKVIFGTISVKSSNVLYASDKMTETYTVKA